MSGEIVIVHKSGGVVEFKFKYLKITGDKLSFYDLDTNIVKIFKIHTLVKYIVRLY